MKEEWSVRFLYNTVSGRMLLKILTKPIFSKISGIYLNSGFSKHKIRKFIRKNNISLDNIEVPPNGFNSFNDFFKRKRKKISYDENASSFISPCDGLLSILRLDEEAGFYIKNTRYSLIGLLKNRKISKEFEGGLALVFRLTPAHYHRYVFVDSGNVIKMKRIKGILHSVRPIAVNKYPVFVENSREYVVMNTDNFGKIIQMEIGALIVGKIVNHKINGRSKKGEEKGYFEFGGSTIVILVKKDVLKLGEKAKMALRKRTEVDVTLGECIAARK